MTHLFHKWFTLCALEEPDGVMEYQECLICGRRREVVRWNTGKETTVYPGWADVKPA